MPWLLLIALLWLTKPGLLGRDDTSLILMARSMVEDNTFTVDRLVSPFPIFDHLVRYGGHYFSNQPPGMAVVLAGLYRLTLNLVSNGWAAATLAALVTTLSVAALGPLAYVAARRLGATHQSSVVGAATLAAGSLVTVYAGTAFPQPVAALLLCVSTYLMLSPNSRSALWAGVAAAGAGVVDYHTLAAAGAVAAVTAVWRKTRRYSLLFIVPVLLAVSALAVYNWYVFGAPWRLPGTMALSSGSVPQYGLGRLASLVPLLWGPGGLFTVSPLLLTALPGWVRLWRGDRRSALTVGLATLAVAAAGCADPSRATPDDVPRALAVLPLVASVMPLGLDWAAERVRSGVLWTAVALSVGYSVVYTASLRLRLVALAPDPHWWVTEAATAALLALGALLGLTAAKVAQRSTWAKQFLAPAMVASAMLVVATALLPIVMAKAEAAGPVAADNLLGNGDFALIDTASGNPMGWTVSQGVITRPGRGVEMGRDSTLISPLIEVRSTDPLVAELSFTGGPIQVTFQWEDLAHRVLETDTYLLEPRARLRASASAPPAASGARLILRAAGPSTLASVHLWQDGVRVEPFPNYYRAALAFSFDWETAMGGAIHSRGDANHDVAGAVGAGLKMREGARWLGNLLASRQMSATFFATGYNLLFGNREGRQFVGNPTYGWANRKNGWASDYWTTHPWYSDDPHGDYLTDPAWYFGDLTLYLKGQGHDIQTHTFGHLYVRGTKPQELDTDLREWNRVATELGLAPAVTFSFPWTSSNSVGPDHYSVLIRNGIKYVTRTYDHPYPYELRAMTGIPELLFLPDQQLEANRSSLSRALSAMAEVVTRRGYLSLWSHPEDAADAAGKEVWAEAIDKATELRNAGQLWVDNVTSLLEYNRALRGLYTGSWRWGNTWRIVVVYEGDKPLKGATLALPRPIVSVEVEGRSWSDFHGTRLRLPELAPGESIELVATVR